MVGSAQYLWMAGCDAATHIHNTDITITIDQNVALFVGSGLILQCTEITHLFIYLCLWDTCAIEFAFLAKIKQYSIKTLDRTLCLTSLSSVTETIIIFHRNTFCFNYCDNLHEAVAEAGKHQKEIIERLEVKS